MKDKFVNKTERCRHKLGALKAYFKKHSGHIILSQDEALAELVDIVQYLLFLIEEYGININNRNNIYKED
jgi:hypothetical protein